MAAMMTTAKTPPRVPARRRNGKASLSRSDGSVRALLDLGAGQRAANFRHTREARRSEVTEDYVELIADLIDNGGEARAVDIAERLGVSHATVVKTIIRLQQSGLVTSRPYRAIFLTEQGRRIADQSRQRHELVVSFLRAIGVSDDIAHADAEGMEHHCSSETLAAFARIIRRHGNS
jgi:DtxR family manganese transport transcriptional regulator